jgi:hypothetical protein
MSNHHTNPLTNLWGEGEWGEGKASMSNHHTDPLTNLWGEGEGEGGKHLCLITILPRQKKGGGEGKGGVGCGGSNVLAIPASTNNRNFQTFSLLGTTKESKEVKVLADTVIPAC